MEEIRLDLNDFLILGDTLQYSWGYPKPGIPYLSIHITHWSASLDGGNCHPEGDVLHLGIASSSSENLPY